MNVPKRGSRDASIRGAAALTAAVFLSCAPAAAAPEGKAEPDDVVVQGQRGSAVTDIDALATLDVGAIEGTGAKSLPELLRIIAPMARSADGGDPIILLNGQRISGFEEVGSLPPEAVEKVEVLPEQAALKFGYPPTRRLLNFITKPRFRAVDASANAGITTAGDSATGGGSAALTRIRNGRRLTLGGEYRHTEPVRQSRRAILPDPANPFDAIGNVVSPLDGEIDPALSAAAGHPVFIAAVPADPAARSELAAYVAGADRPRLFDLGPYRTLVARNDTFKGNAVFATPIAKGISGSFTLTAERKRDQSLQGLPAAPILVPADNPFSPFDRDVLLYRYITGVAPLRQRATTTMLHAGALLHGVIRGWNWDLTGTFDENDVANRSERGVDIAAIDAAIAAGADPFGTFDPSLLGNRLNQHSRSENRKLEVKGVTRGVALRLPTGDVSLTATAEAERATAHTVTRGFQDMDIALGRTRLEAGFALDVPLFSPDAAVLPFLGRLSANLSANVRHVEGYGDLTDSSYGLAWSPLPGLQLIGSVKQTGTAPDMAQRSTPTLETANVPFLDLSTGQSVFVTTVTGGNPNLLAEQKRVRALSLNYQPFANRNLSISLNYEAELLRNQSTQITALTPATMAAFPDLFVRDASGRLTTVFLRPVNLYRERRRTLVAQFNYYGQLGKPPPKTDNAKPPPRPRFYIGMAFTPLLHDDIQLRAGLPSLNLLDGDTVDASATRRSMGIYGWSGLGYKRFGVNLNAQWIGSTRFRGGTPETTLYFAPLLKLDVSVHAKLGEWLSHQSWARKTTLLIELGNPFDARQRVRDANGATPNRYQPDYLDPIGRTVKVTLRKLF